MSNTLEDRRKAMESTIADLAMMLSEDGAALRVIAIDEAAPSAELAVELADLDCEDCVLPPDQLRTTIVAALERGIGAAVAVVVHDARQVSAPLEGAAAAGWYEVLDPTGVAPADGGHDPGPPAGPLAGKTVAIRQDVLWPSFDWTVEEWSTLLEQAGATLLTFARARARRTTSCAGQTPSTSRSWRVPTWRSAGWPTAARAPRGACATP